MSRELIMMIPEKSFAGRDCDQLASTTSSHRHTYTLSIF